MTEGKDGPCAPPPTPKWIIIVIIICIEIDAACRCQKTKQTTNCALLEEAARYFASTPRCLNRLQQVNFLLLNAILIPLFFFSH